MKLLYLFAHSLALLEITNAHSWVECTNYEISNLKDFAEFDRSKCSGYPRNFKTQFEKGFGIDTGYNWAHDFCRDPYVPTDYKLDSTMMAQFTPGQTIFISHPSKNHVADTCTNQFIPSESFKVLMSSTIEQDTFDVSLQMEGPEHTNGVIDYLGYQNCYKFCENQDKSTCVSGWKLPDDIQEGIHSFKWIWEFNKNEFYTNCFDAYISGSVSSFDSSFSDSLDSSTSDSLDSSTSGSFDSSFSSSFDSSSSGSSDNFTIETPEPNVLPSVSPSRTPSVSTTMPTPTSTSLLPITETPTPSDPEVITSVAPNFGFTLFNVSIVGSVILNVTRLN